VSNQFVVRDSWRVSCLSAARRSPGPVLLCLSAPIPPSIKGMHWARMCVYMCVLCQNNLGRRLWMLSFLLGVGSSDRAAQRAPSSRHTTPGYCGGGQVSIDRIDFETHAHVINNARAPTR
jgi:hypothetical protein